jgi:hypothetical protein
MYKSIHILYLALLGLLLSCSGGEGGSDRTLNPHLKSSASTASNSEDAIAEEAPAEEAPTEPAEETPAIEEVLSECEKGLADGTLMEEKKIITFDANKGMPNQCTWLAPKKDGHVRGYRADPKALAIPSGHVVCSMALKSESKLTYDDSLLLTFNDKALLWGNLEIMKLDATDGIYTFNKDKIQDSTIKSGEVGCMEGHDACKVPGTDTEGDLALTFKEDANKKITEEVELNGAVFSLLTFGDNNPEVDCTHSGLELEVTYMYYLK